MEQGGSPPPARGGELPPASSIHPLIREGAAFRPLIRHFDAKGHTIKNGVFPVDWTWLVSDSVDGSVVKCRLATGVQDPLELKYDGRTEYLALAAPVASGAATELVVQTRGTQRPLEDVEVFARG